MFRWMWTSPPGITGWTWNRFEGALSGGTMFASANLARKLSVRMPVTAAVSRAVAPGVGSWSAARRPDFRQTLTTCLPCALEENPR